MKLSRTLARAALLTASTLGLVGGSPITSLFPIIKGAVDVVGLDQLLYCTSGYLQFNCYSIYVLLLKDGPESDINVAKCPQVARCCYREPDSLAAEGYIYICRLQAKTIRLRGGFPPGVEQPIP